MSEAVRENRHFDPLQDLRPSVFWLFWVICFLMMVAPGMPWHGWRGGLLIAAGFVMLVQPPRVQISRLHGGLAAGFLLLACIVFLPAAWFPVPVWRELLSAKGMDTGGLITVHPRQTLECLGAFAVCLTGVMFLTGHRVDHESNHRMGAAFSAGVALIALFATGAQNYHWMIPWDPETTLGFFANRNHMATLLVMGIITGTGVALQSLRVGLWGTGLLALSSVVANTGTLIARSESRAGVVLLASVFTAWLLILGRKYLRGRVLAAAGILGGAALIYYATKESVVKKRVTETAEHLAFIASTGPEDAALWKGKTGADSIESLDLRLSIYLDTLVMLHQQPWTGVGAGQFQYVFPQYRHRSAVLNEHQSVHPESDWLMMGAEAGIPATILLAVLVAAAGVSALREALTGRARALRTGCLMAAAVVPLHGLFDVPGHRIELVWPACWLLAISLRGGSGTRQSTRACRLVFQGLGIAIIGAGAFLVHAQWFGGRTPAVLHPTQTVEKVMALYAEDIAEQKAALAGIPPGSLAEDRLETALRLLDEALKVTPMDAHLHYLRGVIALQFDDKDDDVDRAFALQRLLDPTWVALPLIQASAWAAIDASRVKNLWVDAMKRAEAMERIDAHTPYGRKATFARIMEAARPDPALLPVAMNLAEKQTSLLEDWAAGVGANRLDSLMPAILTAELSGVQHQALFQIWCLRGSRLKAEAYAREFRPELLESVKPASEQTQKPRSGLQ